MAPEKTNYHVKDYMKMWAATVGVKRMSPVDTELLFIILYNIIALHRNTNIFFLWKSSNLNK